MGMPIHNFLKMLQIDPPTGPLHFVQALQDPDVKLGREHGRLIKIVGRMMEIPGVPVDHRQMIGRLADEAVQSLETNPGIARDFLLRGVRALAEACSTGLTLEKYNGALAMAMLQEPDADGILMENYVPRIPLELALSPETGRARENANKYTQDRIIFNGDLDQLLGSRNPESIAVQSVRYNIHMALDADARFLTPELIEKIIRFAQKYKLLDIFKRCYSNATRLGFTLAKPDALQTKDEDRTRTVIDTYHNLIMNLIEIQYDLTPENLDQTSKNMHNLLSVALWDGFKADDLSVNEALSKIICQNLPVYPEDADRMVALLDEYINLITSMDPAHSYQIGCHYEKTKWGLQQLMLFSHIAAYDLRQDKSYDSNQDYEKMAEFARNGRDNWWDQVPSPMTNERHDFFKGKETSRHPDMHIYVLKLLVECQEMAQRQGISYRRCRDLILSEYYKKFPRQAHASLFNPADNQDPNIPRMMAYKLLRLRSSYM